MQSRQGDEHTTLLECANNDTVVTIEPPVGRNEEDSLSSISDVPTVAHFNISVRDIQYSTLCALLVNYCNKGNRVCVARTKSNTLLWV